MRTQEERSEKLERFSAKNPLIDRAAHLNDLELCKRYLKGDRLPFEAMFETAYEKLERYVVFHYCRKNSGTYINKHDTEDVISAAATPPSETWGLFRGGVYSLHG